MKKLIAALIVLLANTAHAGPAAPQNGLWWNSSESGRGYSIDSQNEWLVLTFFGYDEVGNMQWYYADGPLGCGGYCWSGQLLKFTGGTPLNGTYRPPVATGSSGPISISFSSRIAGTMTFPSGRRISIERFNHSTGSPPQALLGVWAYAYTIGSTNYLDTWPLTQILSATSTGTGLVANSTRNVAFEYQKSGGLAGMVVGFHWSGANATGTIIDQYAYELQIEEGRGYWVGPNTGNQYGMSAYKIITSSGTAKDLRAEARDNEAKGGAVPMGKGVTLEQLQTMNPEMGRIAAEMQQKLAR